MVNLTAYETFFDEKRPFFTEGGVGLLALRARSGASDYTTFFYPEPPDLLFAAHRARARRDARPATTWTRRPRRRSWARPSSPGARAEAGRWASWRPSPAASRAQLSSGPVSSNIEVEPLTNYFVATSGASWDGARRLGILATAVNRSLGPSLDEPAGEPGLRRRRRRALLAGPAPRTGSSSAARRQLRSPAAGPPCCACRRSAQRYYQRPGCASRRRSIRSATSLSGWSGRLGINKNSGNVTANAGVVGDQPRLEPNDAGFATQADRGGGHGC